MDSHFISADDCVSGPAIGPEIEPEIEIERTACLDFICAQPASEKAMAIRVPGMNIQIAKSPGG
jgi:hypothetical protein